MRATFFLAVGLLFGAATLGAQTPLPGDVVTLPVPTAPAPDMNGGEATMSLTVAGMVVMTSATPTEVKPTVFIDVDTPLPVGSRNGKPYNLGRVFARLGIGTSPGNSVPADPTLPATGGGLAALGNPANFESIEGGLGIARVIGVSADGSIKTSILAEVGFKTRRGTDPTAVDPTSHYWGAGFRLSNADGSAITVLGGQDGELGQAGAMQVMVYGQLVVPKTAGCAMLVGDASFSFFAPVSVTLPIPAIPPGSSVTVPQAGALRSNIVQLGVAIDAAQVFSQLVNKGKS
jgi:hypothetical protein